MAFFDREAEVSALMALARAGGLAVVWGRRRIGKTRLLLEWCERTGGLYTVADQSAPGTQRAYFARAVATVLPQFDDVTYPDWERLLARLARDAEARRFRGPIVIDELPYLVAATPELPSILQRWIDHDAKRARLAVALAGSSQRMMQGIVLAHDAPLYGRAAVLLDLQGLPPDELTSALGDLSPIAHVEHWAAWGGIPRYWELAAATRGSAKDRVVDLVLDPLGPLFSEPERLLLEEMPPATEVRPVLDAIGAGAHRLSEIAGRLGRVATSLGKPIDRLVGMSLVRRETPHGEPERGGKRSLYKIADPFLRLWFRVVAPDRAALVAGTRASRRAILDKHWDALVAQAWEDLCRLAIPTLPLPARRTSAAAWRPARRYWHGAEPEWDIVADDLGERRTLVGEAWFARRAVTANILAREAKRIATRQLPPSVDHPVRALFVPMIAPGARRLVDDVHVITFDDVLRAHATRRAPGLATNAKRAFNVSST